MAGFLDLPIVRILERGLDASSLRHQAISDNLANIDTPGYKRKEVVFEDELASALRGDSFQGKLTHPKHIPLSDSSSNASAKVVTQEDQEYRNDKNNVDVDREMALLAKNTLWYDGMVSLASQKLSTLKSTIREVR
ncbi:flagellar basal body rod protein FlgB [Heliobacterium chlorum]|uniref:Flagellar basal body rod protein FlgB n=1 Tax=Heliobacterium chlorum TaxID=2698 RepID=A0ABR7SY06_HELCL|nr:flagellar basal body rod protein FlgB [Heliobacterium chlorum]MBC9783408.1 flagellar basal body rod protein FlgB [Heliobacterium chlorum]